MFLIQKRTIFVALLCWSRNKMMQVEERHYYYYWRECECVCGWMSGLVPWLHLLHPMQHTRWEQMCTKIEKPLKDGFTTSYTDATYKNLNKRRKVDFEATGNLFRAYTQAIFWPHTHKTVEIRTPEAIPAHAVIAYAMLFISLCSSPHRVDICEHEPSVREFAHVLTASKGWQKSVCLFVCFLMSARQ